MGVHDLSIIDNLLQLLDEKGLSQADLCKYLGINTSTMTNWKQRGTDPAAKYIIPICEFINVSPYKLLTGSEKQLDSSDEELLITYYRQLNEKHKGIIIGEAKALASNEND